MASINALGTLSARVESSKRCEPALPGLTSYMMLSNCAHKHGFLTILTLCRYSPWLLLTAALCVPLDYATVCREHQSNWQITSTSLMRSWNGAAQALIIM